MRAATMTTKQLMATAASLAVLSACGRKAPTQAPAPAPAKAAAPPVVLHGQEDPRTDADGAIVTADELAENPNAVATPPSAEVAARVKASCIIAFGGGGKAYPSGSGGGLSPGELGRALEASGKTVTWTGDPTAETGVMRVTYTDAVADRQHSFGLQFSVTDARSTAFAGCGPEMSAVDRLVDDGRETSRNQKIYDVDQLARMALRARGG